MSLSRGTSGKIFLTVFLVYLFYIAPGFINAGTNRFIALTKTMVDDKTFVIDKYHDISVDVAVYKDHHYIGAVPGLAFMAAPVYVCLKPLVRFIPEKIYKNIEYSVLILFFAFFLSVMPGALIAVLLYDLLKYFGLEKKERILAVFASSFGTLLFFYSTKFMAHVMGAFLGFGAFYILFKLKNKILENKYWYFLAGLLLGLATLVEYTHAIGAALLTFYALAGFKKEKIKHYILFILGATLMALVFFSYHYKCFGSPFTLATTYSAKCGPIPFSWPRLKFIFEFTLGPYRGMFLYMPILLISFYGIFTFFKRPDKRYLQEMILICVFFISVLFMLCIMANWHWPWGGSFGPRHFVSCIPFLMIPIAFAYRKLKCKVILWFAAVSIFVNWCGVQYGDSDNVVTNMGLFIFKGLNSNLAEWGHYLTNTYVRKLNVITHLSPLLGVIALLACIYLIWKTEISKFVHERTC